MNKGSELKTQISDTPVISVVIPAFNEERFLTATLDSLFKQKIDKTVEVIVVNNNSTDKTKEIAHGYSVRVIDEKKKGITHARQAGLMAARGDIIVTTDADTTFIKDWLYNLTLPFFNNGKVNVTYGPSYYEINGSIRVFLFMWGTQILRYILFLIPFVVAGHNMAFRREKALKIGGYDTTLTHSEDFDISKRIWRGQLFSSKFVVTAGVVTSARRVSKENFLWRIWMTIKDTIGYYTDSGVSKEYDDYR